jgi:hypothetical protein
VTVSVRPADVTVRTGPGTVTAMGFVTVRVGPGVVTTALVTTFVGPGIRINLVGPPGIVRVLPGTVNVRVRPSLASVIVRVFPDFCFSSVIVSVCPPIVVTVVFT